MAWPGPSSASRSGTGKALRSVVSISVGALTVSPFLARTVASRLALGGSGTWNDLVAGPLEHRNEATHLPISRKRRGFVDHLSGACVDSTWEHRPIAIGARCRTSFLVRPQGVKTLPRFDTALLPRVEPFAPMALVKWHL